MGVVGLFLGLISGAGSDRLSFLYLVGLPDVYAWLPHQARKFQVISCARSTRILSGTLFCCTKGPLLSESALREGRR